MLFGKDPRFAAWEFIERERAKKNGANFASIYQGFFTIHPERVYVEYMENGAIVSITYRDYEALVRKTVTYLNQRLKDIPKGSFIGYKVDTHPFWVSVFWGLLGAGYNVLLIDSKHDLKMTSYLLQEAGALAVIASRNDTSEFPVYRLDYETILEERKGGVFGVGGIAEGNTAWGWGNYIAICTSGTTATSKIYVYDESEFYDFLRVPVDGIRRFNPILRKQGEKMLAMLPFHHIFGLFLIIVTHMTGSVMVFPENRTPSVLIDTCQKHRVTILITIPLFLNGVARTIRNKVNSAGEKQVRKMERIIKVSLHIQKEFGFLGTTFCRKVLFKKQLERIFGSEMRILLSGGGHIAGDTLELMNSLGYCLMNGYGSTEAGVATLCLTGLTGRLSGSIGKPFSHIRLAVLALGPDGVEQIQKDGVGELLIQGATLHVGRMVGGKMAPPERYQEVWFRTGDVVRMTKNGFVYIEGRSKEVIINESGENVYPDEVEEYFANLPGCEAFSVLGLKGEGNDITALVIKPTANEPGALAQIAAAFSEINDRLPINKRVGQALVSDQPLPMVNGIKVSRVKLSQMISAGDFPCRPLDLKSAALTPSQDSDEGRANQIRNEIKRVIAGITGMKPELIGDDDHLMIDLGLESMMMMELATKLEKQYDLVIPDGDMYKYFTIRGIVAEVCQRLYGTAGTALAGVAASQAWTSPRIDRQPVTRFEESVEYRQFQERKQALAQVGKTPYFVRHDSAIKDTSMIDGKAVINFGSYNYLGLSGDPRVVKAAQDAAAAYGTSASGSRVLAGEKTLFRELEAELADWHHTEDCIVFSQGYATNVTFIGNFCNQNDLILYDALSHNSILQGCRLSVSDTKAFPHNDFQTLEDILKRCRNKYEKILIVMESVYSMDGDIAPVPEFVRLKKEYGGFLMVDEAHSTGVLGKTGGGVDDYFGLAPEDIDFKMGTLSKALGTCGGYIAGKAQIIEYLMYNIPGFVFTAGISPALAAATLEAVRIIRREPVRVQAIQNNIFQFYRLARARGYDTMTGRETPIIPIRIGADEDAFLISMAMLERGVFVPPAVYPAVPKGSARLRFCITSEHKPEQIKQAFDCLDEVSGFLNIPIPKVQAGDARV
ncbi:MAG TPA: aminotransferase class I/II-fold pyridoxal phosphate-dependent enzyme [Bacillota bacterium]|nr:aminotransferase class I/II-fold pyridoxal phosphate-dependent enzyme [Bacillota bacterium]